MAGINLSLNANLQAFKDFSVYSAQNPNGGEKTVAMSKAHGPNLGGFTVTKSDVKSRSGALDQLHFWGRTDDMMAANNNTRRDFYNAVLEQFGGDPANIPENVKDAMLLGDSGIDKKNPGSLDGAFKTGKPLLARRIDAVIKEIEKVQAKTCGAAAFNSFYDEMAALAPGADVKASFQAALSRELKDFCGKLAKNADQEIFRSCIDARLQEMSALLGDNPAEFKLHAGMEKILKTLRDDIAAKVTSKADKAVVKAGFNSLVDSFKIERKMDEKIAAVFNKRFTVTEKVNDKMVTKTFPSVNEGDRKLADLQAELARLEAENPQDEAKVKKAKDAIEAQMRYLHGSDRTKSMDFAIKALLNDKEFCALAARKDYGLVTRDDLVAGDAESFDKNVENTGKKDTFIKGMGSTSQVLEKYVRDNPGEKICVHVYGDRTFPFCGLLTHWGTQEEATVRDANVKTFAGMIGKGLVKPSQKMKDRFEFATDKMDSIRGFTINTSMRCAGQVKNARPINVTFLFSSMPSHAHHSHSLDAEGDYDFLMDCKGLYEDWKVEDADLPQARKFINTLHGLWKGEWGNELKAEKGYTAREFHTALKFLKFSGPNDHFNVFGGDSKAEMIKLLDFVKNNFTQEELDAKTEIAEGAKRELAATKQELELMQSTLEQARAKLPAYEEANKALQDARTAYKAAKDQAKSDNVKFEESPDFKRVNDALTAAEAKLQEVTKELKELGFNSAKLDDEMQKKQNLVTSREKGLKDKEAALKAVTDKMNSVEGKSFGEIMEKSNANYVTIVKRHVHEWITMARATGAKVFLGGPIGAGAFGNDPDFVAKIFAEEFKANGGDMKFLYAMYNTEDKNVKLWNAFLKAFEEAGLADRLVFDDKQVA